MSDYRLDRAADHELEDLLETYARVRLTAPNPVLARIRRHVMAQAATMAAARREAAQSSPPRARRWIPRLPLPAPVFALGFAALLTAGTTAAVVAAPPGSAFYNARLYIETAMMPPAANMDARLAAYEEQFTHRIAEAEAALARGDQAGLNAALAAYQNEITAAVAELGSTVDLERLSHLESVLGKHIARLEQLATTLPTKANAITHAVAASQKAVEKIQAAKTGAGGSPGSGGQGSQGSQAPAGSPSGPGTQGLPASQAPHGGEDPQDGVQGEQGGEGNRN